jgi:hypothetical protein
MTPSFLALKAANAATTRTGKLFETSETCVHAQVAPWETKGRANTVSVKGDEHWTTVATLTRGMYMLRLSPIHVIAPGRVRQGVGM